MDLQGYWAVRACSVRVWKQCCRGGTGDEQSCTNLSAILAGRLLITQFLLVTLPCTPNPS